MPRATVGDTSLTGSYIPKVSQRPSISPTIAHFHKPIENQCIHEGRVVDQLYYTSDHIDCCFSNIRLNYLYEINEPIVPRFILDFYSQVTLQRDNSSIMLISFIIQKEFITLSLQQFSQILRIPFNVQSIFTNGLDLASKIPNINIIPPKQLFVNLTHDDTKTPSPEHQLSSPNAPNAPSKTPSTKGISSSSIDYTPKLSTSSTSPSTNGYLNSPTSLPLRVPPPPPTQENTSMDITLTLSPITPLDVQFNTPSPSLPIFGHLETHVYVTFTTVLLSLD
nr:DNA helicase Pif1-like protein [Tanacetum cinerariifolium]